MISQLFASVALIAMISINNFVSPTDEMREKSPIYQIAPSRYALNITWEEEQPHCEMWFIEDIIQGIAHPQLIEITNLQSLVENEIINFVITHDGESVEASAIREGDSVFHINGISFRCDIIKTPAVVAPLVLF